MKNYFILLFFTAISCSIYSQNSKTGIIYYTHVDNHYGVAYNSYLLFNQNKSNFVTAKDSLGLFGGYKNTADDETLVEISDFDDVSKTRRRGLQVFSNKLNDTIYFTNAFSLTSRVYYVKEKRPELNWQFEKKTKKIGNFNCNKATVEFRGRKYIAWYTQDIPLPYGPWKLQGLPGMILEAESVDGFFKISFKKIKYPVQKIQVFKNENALLIKGKKFMSFKRYVALQRRHIELTDNGLKLHAKKFDVKIEPFSERDNFLEIFGSN
tara:strand:+ start:178 stop:975 length:798 start_codon:yes stop_codon:yes gene_type:complete